MIKTIAFLTLALLVSLRTFTMKISLDLSSSLVSLFYTAFMFIIRTLLIFKGMKRTSVQQESLHVLVIEAQIHSRLIGLHRNVNRLKDLCWRCRYWDIVYYSYDFVSLAWLDPDFGLAFCGLYYKLQDTCVNISLIYGEGSWWSRSSWAMDFCLSGLSSNPSGTHGNDFGF